LSIMNNLIRFEKQEHDLDGFWAPVSSSIDWCERNYVVSWYIAEFWNSLSSFVIILFAIWGIMQVSERNLELRFWLFHGSIIFVGLGSICFHGTLTYFGQLGDELPMIWTMLIWWYILINMENNGNKLVGFILTVYGFIFSVVHCFQAFTTVFQVHSVLLILFGLFYVIRYSFQYYHSHPIVPLLGSIYFIAMIGASIAWVIDQQFCKELHSLEVPGSIIRIPNPQLHAIWHILVGYATNLSGIYARVVRYIIVNGKSPKVDWAFSFWPLPQDFKTKKY